MTTPAFILKGRGGFPANENEYHVLDNQAVELGVFRSTPKMAEIVADGLSIKSISPNEVLHRRRDSELLAEASRVRGLIMQENAKSRGWDRQFVEGLKGELRSLLNQLSPFANAESRHLMEV